MLRDTLEYRVRVLSSVPFRLLHMLSLAPLKDMLACGERGREGSVGLQAGKGLRGRRHHKALSLHLSPPPL